MVPYWLARARLGDVGVGDLLSVTADDAAVVKLTAELTLRYTIKSSQQSEVSQPAGCFAA